MLSGTSETLECDVVIVGSGAGGSVIAAECARAGKTVLVLEMGQYRNEQDFNQLEVQGYQELYYGGGLATSESGSISITARSKPRRRRSISAEMARLSISGVSATISAFGGSVRAGMTSRSFQA